MYLSVASVERTDGTKCQRYVLIVRKKPCLLKSLISRLLAGVDMVNFSVE